MRIRWTPEAAADLERWPNIGRPGWTENTRELAVAGLPYLVIYRVAQEAVHVLRIHHGAQNWRQ